MNQSKLTQLKYLLTMITPEAWRFVQEGDAEPDGNALVVDVQDVTIARFYQQPMDTWLAVDNARFVTLAHELMPDLLEAVRVLERVVKEAESITNGTTTWPFAHRLIEKLNAAETKLGAREILVSNVDAAQQALNECTDRDLENDMSADLIRAEGTLAEFDSRVSQSYKVNGYVFVPMDVIANSAKDAGRLAINSNFEWDLNTSKYDASWSINECMMVDVVDSITGKDQEFEYLDLAEPTELQALTDGTLYSVGFYLNVHLVIDDAEDEEDALRKVNGVDFFGELKANGIVIDSWGMSDTLPFEVKS
jgi:hypothetical protein